ncbi:YceI family protein [Massilia agilis]|uniref:YceI family protein n=1 Tax=Massilia agilis TaxID=1811226 RepID=A0ABT2DH53_9BURK|nr:YceI family protein [Massilia agilis]MCS0810592.1 YceI family protein [Massilia agilis]
MKASKPLMALVIGACASAAFAADTYTIEPKHTFPSFETDHMGISVWRGKFTKTSGTVVLDRAAKTGSVDIAIDPASIQFGLVALDDHVKGADMLDVAKYPTATYKGPVVFKGDVPAEINGELTLHGVTKPVKLAINSFKCIQHPMLKREVCGADASGSFNRGDFGVSYGLPKFQPEVRLQIQVEAIKQ